MGKALDTREVEYAYVREVGVIPNLNKRIGEGEGQATTFTHRITISYELKDINKVWIGERTVDHYIDGVKLSVADMAQLLADNLRPLVRADKLELSGYDIA